MHILKVRHMRAFMTAVVSTNYNVFMMMDLNNMLPVSRWTLPHVVKVSLDMTSGLWAHSVDRYSQPSVITL